MRDKLIIALIGILFFAAGGVFVAAQISQPPPLYQQNYPQTPNYNYQYPQGYNPAGYYPPGAAQQGYNSQYNPYYASNPSYYSPYSSSYGSNGFLGGGTYAGYVNTQPQPTLQSYYSTPIGEGLGSGVQTYWPILGDAETCLARQDLILNVPPAGCSPVVVRSDLLAEQNVPVFCQIDSYKINPLIDINSIQSMTFSGQYPPEVLGAGFHPARAAIRSGETLLGAPLANNVGYIVVVLKRQPDERKLPDFVNVTLGARINYISGNSLGIGANEFLLKPMSDSDWNNDKHKQSFWNGRYFVRLEDAQDNYATVSIYNGNQKVVTQRVQSGTTSPANFLPGLYCQAGLQISYDGIISADQTAKIEVSDDKSTDVFDVIQGSQFLNNRCNVNYLDVAADGQSGRVIVNCPGRTFELVLGRALYDGQNLSVQGVNVVPVRQSFGYELNLEVLQDGRKGSYLYDFNGILSKRNATTGALGVLVDYRGQFVGSGNTSNAEWYLELWRQMGEITGIRNAVAQGGSQQNLSQAKPYYTNAINNFESVSDDYASEVSDSGTKYGQLALESGVNLAQKFGDAQTQSRLLKKLIDNYPVQNQSYSNMMKQISGADTSQASQAVEFEEGTKVIRLIGFNSPKQRSSAEFSIDGRGQTLNVKAQRIQLVSSGVNGVFTRGEISIDNVDPQQAFVTAYCANANGVIPTYGDSYILRTFEPERIICGSAVKLIRTNVNSMAKIRLYPTSQGTQTLTNVTVTIGIEKRAIKISPEKAREKIENLNKSIKKWEEISKNMGTVVSGLKTACFATSAVLTFKNFVTGLSGETIARQQVMNGENGWRNRCAKLVGDGAYATVDQCYLAKSGEIDAEVSKNVNAINKVNQKIQSIQGKYTTTTDIFGQSVDAEKLRTALAAQARADYGNTMIDVSNFSKKYFVTGPDGKQIQATSITINELLSDENMKNGAVSTDALKTIMVNAELKNSGASGEQLKNINSYLSDSAVKINDNRIAYQDLEKAKADADSGFGQPFYLNPDNQQMRVADVVRMSDDTKNKTGFTEVVNYVSTAVVSGGTATEKSPGDFESGTYRLGLVGLDSGQGIYGVKEIYFVDKNESLAPEKVKQFLSKYGVGNLKGADRVSYSHQIISTDRKCRFYETEPYRGMPAVIPFDYRNGWYAATRQTLPAFGGIGAFDKSGRVTSFWLCNVGDNGRVEFESGFGDDLCQQINLNTGQPLGSFPGLSDADAKTKISQATSAIEQAARQYPNKVITVNGERCEVGAPSSGQPGTQCQDFMSPKDCLLLFNVCDPVICPPSRCNLGGTYNVADVAQSGLVGSIFLCLPNIREGVAMPVCLTGIQAGIDAWTSIMKNYRDCLQENIDTGQTVGICDEIHSIYLCEFFWGQIAPFVNVIIPKLIEIAYGQGVRGGGEYLTVQSSWQNMENSINYFTNHYAVNSMNAFRARSNGQYGSNPYSLGSIAEVGTSFCQNFMSIKAPSAFQSLVEPDSPPQFYAWFDEKTFSTVTVPATSQYKVFYHIFAGNDAGVQFSVYLKGAPESSFYATNPFVTVDTGFVARGQYASNTKDFTAPQSYKQLCVRINAQEECGFGQVSTDFAINYIRDSWVKGELQNTNINSEKDCVSGSNNPGALLNPNIQAGVESFVSPDVYNRGVVRICSTDNPGKGTDPTRFVNVGNCGDTKVGCWLDKRSVDNALTNGNVGARNETLQVLQNQVDNYLINSGELFNNEQSAVEIQSLKLAFEDLKKESASTIIGKAQDMMNRIDFDVIKVVLSRDKAQLILLRGQVNAEVAMKLKAVEDASRPAPQLPTPGQGVAQPSNNGINSGTGASSGKPVEFLFGQEAQPNNKQENTIYFELTTQAYSNDKFYLSKFDGDAEFGLLYQKKDGTLVGIGRFVNGFVTGGVQGFSQLTNGEIPNLEDKLQGAAIKYEMLDGAAPVVLADGRYGFTLGGRSYALNAGRFEISIDGINYTNASKLWNMTNDAIERRRLVLAEYELRRYSSKLVVGPPAPSLSGTMQPGQSVGMESKGEKTQTEVTAQNNYGIPSPLTLDNARVFLEGKISSSTSGSYGSYVYGASQVPEFTEFVNQLYSMRLISESEFVDINGSGWLNMAETVNWVVDLLKKKKEAQQTSQSGTPIAQQQKKCYSVQIKLLNGRQYILLDGTSTKLYLLDGFVKTDYVNERGGRISLSLVPINSGGLIGTSQIEDNVNKIRNDFYVVSNLEAIKGKFVDYSQSKLLVSQGREQFCVD